MDLHKGMKGPLVYTVQELINGRIPSSQAESLDLNGTFDEAMEGRVKMFQADWNLTPTGIVDDITLTVLQNDRFAFEVDPRPPVVLQNENRFHCWAAALSSWSQQVPHVQSISVDEAISYFRKFRGALDPDNDGITQFGWSAVQHRYHLGFAAYGGEKGKDVDELTLDHVFRLTKSKGCLLLAFNLPETNGAIAHTLVIFGVYLRLNSENPDKNGYALWAMDPFQLGYTPKKLAYIRTSGEVLIMWKK